MAYAGLVLAVCRAYSPPLHSNRRPTTGALYPAPYFLGTAPAWSVVMQAVHH